ncbi:7706_t:CDS:10 [Racocetra fulgida]|uniref:RNA helicase n=1 Tax=Racocetra fulgida TaxID=60492 RepID=A0A9N9ADT4_9GLOM|nr:7706_t:CDS:10 [Racocetra fulgida]
MNSKRPLKPFAFGFSQGSAAKSKSLLDPEEQAETHKKPTALDYFSDEDSQPKKRKLVKLDDDLDEDFDKQDGASNLSNVNEDYVGDLEDDRPPPPRTSTGIRGFVPQGFSFNKNVTNIHENMPDNKLDVQKDDEIDDPLDAFMLDIDSQVQKESQSKSIQEKIRRDDIEDEDFVESYVNHMKKKGIEVGKSQRPIEKDENVNSDEEVYATAKAIDAQLEYDSDDNPVVEQKRKDIEPLPAVGKYAAVPVAMSGRDIIGIAKTGSGKTAAFIWPMLIHIMDQEELHKGEGPIGLILAPTRELASQIYIEAKKFAKSYVAAVYGGASKMDQFKELRPGGIEILVGTPEYSNILISEYHIALLFSATFPKKVEILAREVTTEPVRISIGSVGQANTDITQRIEILTDDGYKWGGALHGDMMQADRDKVLKDFKNNKFPIMVATDVAGAYELVDFLILLVFTPLLKFNKQFSKGT